MNDEIKRDRWFAIAYQVIRVILPIFWFYLFVDCLIDGEIFCSVVCGLAAVSYAIGTVCKWKKAREIEEMQM